MINYNLHNAIAKKVNSNTKDFQNIVDVIGKEPVKIYVTQKYDTFYEVVPYAVPFYLSGHCITSRIEDCDYVLSHKKDYCSNSLTPDNDNAFLFAE